MKKLKYTMEFLIVALICIGLLSGPCCLASADTDPAVVPGESDTPPAVEEETGGTAFGWQEADGKKYFVLETGEQATGWQEIDGKKYYFLQESGEQATGWQEIDGKKYYFLQETGEQATGWQKIGGKKYYFLKKTGELATGWQEIDGKKYYFLKKTGEPAAGWKKINEKKYYFSKKTNQMLTGLQKIGGIYYIFDSKGRLAQSKKASIVTVGNNIYCAGKNGRPKSGWQIVGKKLYYASKKGRVKKNTKYDGIKFTKSGAAKDNLESRVKIKTMKVFASIVNDKMSKKEKLRACWSYVVSGRFHYAGKYPNLNSSGWQRKTAYDMLTTKSGNCYSFACAFAALAKEAGYKPYVVCGRVHGSRDGASDGYTRHAWVKIDGRYYDPEAQYAGWCRGIYGNSGYPVAHQTKKTVAY